MWILIQHFRAAFAIFATMLHGEHPTIYGACCAMIPVTFGYDITAIPADVIFARTLPSAAEQVHGVHDDTSTI